MKIQTFKGSVEKEEHKGSVEKGKWGGIAKDRRKARNTNVMGAKERECIQKEELSLVSNGEKTSKQMARITLWI